MCRPGPSFFLLLHCEHPGRVKVETDPVIPSRWPEKYPPPSSTVHPHVWEAGAVPGLVALTQMFQYGLDSAKGNAWGEWVRDAS